MLRIKQRVPRDLNKLRLAHTLETSFKCVQYSEHGNPQDVLDVVSKSLGPKNSEGNTIVSWLAAAINPSDINQIEGVYPIKPNKFPAVPGTEGVGVVVESSANELQPGDRVVAAEPLMGTWQEYGRYKHTQLAKVDPELPVGAAATLSINPATAYRMLIQHPKAESEEDCVVIQNGANSVVGQIVIQMAHQMGFQTINVVRDREFSDRLDLAELLCDLGGDFVGVDKNLKEDLKLIGLTIRTPPLLALNSVGGSSALTIASLLGKDGLMLTYGGLSKKPVPLPTGRLIFKNITAKGFWLSGSPDSDRIDDIRIGERCWSKFGMRWRWKYRDLEDVKDAISQPKTSLLSEKTVLLTEAGRKATQNEPPFRDPFLG